MRTQQTMATGFRLRNRPLSDRCRDCLNTNHGSESRRPKTATPSTCSKVVSPSMFSVVLVLLSVSLGTLPSHGFSAASIPVAASTAAPDMLVHSEEECVRDQLGYLPSNYVGVSAWKKHQPNSGHRGLKAVVRVSNATTVSPTTDAMVPVAIQTYPLNGGAKRRQNKAQLPADERRKQATATPKKSVVQSPFPTLFWLTCPDISKAVANLERRGFVQIFENTLNSDPGLAHRLYLCHEEYSQLRWKSLTEDDRNVLVSAPTPSLQRMRNMMECSGISGTNFTDICSWDSDYAERVAAASQSSDIETVGSDKAGEAGSSRDTTTSAVPAVVARVPPIKCLHAHYAHYRSTVSLESTRFINPVGELIHRQLQQDFPDLDL